MTDSIDRDNLAMLKDVMEDEFALLLQTYIDDCLARIPQLRQQVSAAQADELRRNAHSIKGSSSNIGAALMTDIASQMEDKAREGSFEGLEDLIDQIESEFGVVRAALGEFLG